ncbi:uncharacterized protein LOC113139781 [Mastacembelus armatus]|uniref:uncharacterized protein LOC113139781 n=1 Tax=Mastacembelus armatus TaxID=205130 RepID=UPI000E459457|nr:uncharacterized protein LOC113139781 [Mastacembelus armatus]
MNRTHLQSHRPGNKDSAVTQLNRETFFLREDKQTSRAATQEGRGFDFLSPGTDLRSDLMSAGVKMVFPPEEVEVESGVESVELPFKTTADLPEDITVKWMKLENDEVEGEMVHVYQNGYDQPEEQHRFYRTRTEMNEDLLTTGDLSLTLKHPTGSDRKTFICKVYREGRVWMEKEVKLSIRVPQVEVESGAESVQLPFRTGADLSGDVRVEWKDRYNRKVHVYQNGSDRPEEQDEFYRNRTEMNEDLLRTGDLTLTLRHPRSLNGNIRTFTCKVYIQQQEVEVESGAESVQLPFITTADLPEDVRVEWKDWNNRKVHVYQNGSDRSEEQDEFYRNRTEMKKDLLSPGNLSLTLKHPTGRDKGTFTCTVYSRRMEKQMKIHF